MESPTNRIKEVLIEKGIKQTWLAEKLGKSFTIVNSYVCNRRQPSLELLFQIAEILQVNPKDLNNCKWLFQTKKRREKRHSNSSYVNCQLENNEFAN